MVAFYGMKRARSANDWKQFVGEIKWKEGYSAFELAHAWQEAARFPSRVARALATSAELANLHLDHGIIEHSTRLDTGNAPSITDLMVYARSEGKDGPLVVLAVEGKVHEAFGEAVGAWLNPTSPTRQRRLAFLEGILNLRAPVPPTLPYQLLHRTASAVLEAGRLGAEKAVVLVHSFASDDTTNFQAFSAFLRLLGITDPRKDAVSGPVTLGEPSRRVGSGIRTYFAWVSDTPRGNAQDRR